MLPVSPVQPAEKAVIVTHSPAGGIHTTVTLSCEDLHGLHMFAVLFGLHVGIFWDKAIGCAVWITFESCQDEAPIIPVWITCESPKDKTPIGPIWITCENCQDQVVNGHLDYL